MTTELTKAAQQALEALKHGVAQLNGIGIPLEADPLHGAITALERALTQRPAAPTAQQLESAAKVCDGFAAPDMAAALRGQRPAAQTEREAFEAWIKKYCGDLSTFGTGHNRHYVNSAVNNAWNGWQARASLPAPQQATPEPVGEPRQFPVLKGKTLFSVPWSMLVPHERQARANHGQSLERLAERGGLSPVEMVAVVLGKRWRDVEGMSAADAEASLSKMVTARTHPAPGVPEGLIEYLRHVRETFANGPMAHVPQVRGQIIALDVWIDALAAAQAKGGV